MNLLQRLFRRNPVTAPAAAPASRKRSFLAGARATRFLSEWVTGSLTIDKTVRQSSLKLRSRARELQLNNPFVRQYLNLLQSNVIGDVGMKLQCQTRFADGTFDKKVNDAIERAYAKWARKASSDGRLTLTQVAHLAIKALAVDGEVFVELVTAEHNDSWFSLHVLDADLIDSELNRDRGVDGNEIRMGIEVDEYMRPVAYHVRTHHRSEAGAVGRQAFRVIPADRVLHIFDPDRADQTRGVSWLNSVMVTLHQYEKYSEAELVSARTASSKMGFLKYSDAAVVQLAKDQDEAGKDPDDEGFIPMNPLQYDASPGAIEMLPPGLEFEAWSPNGPDTAYESYAKSILREIASGLGVSYNALASDLTGVNYSSLRSGMLIERDTWRRIQQLFIDRFYIPVFEAWLSNALLAGAIDVPTKDPKKYDDVRFIARGWQWVDPLKDVNASILAVQNGFASMQQVCAETGTDYEEILEQQAQERQLREKLGLTVAETDMTAVVSLLKDTFANEQTPAQ